MDPRVLTSVGLGMDIVGIVLLFLCGGIGGRWIDRNEGVLTWRSDQSKVERDRRAARWGAGLGLTFAVVGFALQILAQWVP